MRNAHEFYASWRRRREGVYHSRKPACSFDKSCSCTDYSAFFVAAWRERRRGSGESWRAFRRVACAAGIACWEPKTQTCYAFRYEGPVRGAREGR
ncbi:hypothetical protein B0H12DRAFT_1129887 [Mycena haematopus]|nr:hypothetical protein B0H12DRAFT_1129887 [Mycena haematopus]